MTKLVETAEAIETVTPESAAAEPEPADPIITIRPMTAEDYPEVFALWEHIAGFRLRSIDDSEEGVTRFLRRNPTTSVVAVATHPDAEDPTAEKIVGSILCGHDGRQGALYHVCVMRDYRKHGIGRRMVAAAMRALNEEHISKCTLVAFSDNKVGNAFWEGIGWTPRPDFNCYEFLLNPENITRFVDNED